MKKLLFVLSLTVCIAAFNSCGPTRYTVTEQPAVPYYVRPVAPNPAYVWVDGDWYWSGGRYVYRNGYWAKPYRNRIWVRGTWARSGNGYYWRRGHWR